MYLSGANGSKVLGMREEYDPVIADEVMEFDVSFRSVGLKVRGG